MAANFSNFSEDPNRTKERDMSKCFEPFGQCAVDERSDIRVFIVALSHIAEFIVGPAKGWAR
jgi:hypothetical protein